jgi:glutamyl-tRNA reductase
MVANRTFQSAYQLVASFGVSAVRWQAMDIELGAADVLITCTGASGIVFSRERIEAARGGRDMVLVDLALPRDIEAIAGTVDGVTLIDLEVLSHRRENTDLAQDIESVRGIVADEVRAFLAARAASNVTPTVVALRTMATEVVAAEIARLESRRPDLDESDLAEIRQAIRRVADKLIHAPTVRVQELTEGPLGLTYADALADLFALDQATVDAVTRVSGDRA